MLGQGEGLLLLPAVALGQGVALLLVEGQELPLTERAAVGETEREDERVGLPVPLLLAQAEAERLGLCVGDTVAEGEGVGQGLGVEEVDCEGAPLTLPL